MEVAVHLLGATGMGRTVRTRLVQRLLQESVTVLMSCVKESKQMSVLLLYYTTLIDFSIYIHTVDILRTSTQLGIPNVSVKY